MKRTFTLATVLLGALTPGFSQKLMLTGSYTRVSEDSFAGVASTSLHTVLPLGQHMVAGVGISAGRNRQVYQDFISYPDAAGGGRAIGAYHNFLYSLQGFLAARLAFAPHYEATIGPSAGFYLLGARERSDELKPGFGLWSNVTYKHIGGSRFNVDAVFHPKVLLRSFPVEDANFRFDDQRLFVWDAQVGISYDLKRQP
ncbi:hypothetical protein MTX78_12745 [Hymenobacter tibetensis]|uniref:Outer membrane protein beta-barrel domain-containing protein n=1 Tax=Hymenobacter tibetensis TaxID=497967 RepID=A0ABY4CRV7_9BACT|nr:hypothetical protein [Hymenobacter tibetensis]UOG72994.1 hypothetical protein MTX78_12745 [Hymenobacter tibetensis]